MAEPINERRQAIQFLEEERRRVVIALNAAHQRTIDHVMAGYDQCIELLRADMPDNDPPTAENGEAPMMAIANKLVIDALKMSNAFLKGDRTDFLAKFNVLREATNAFALAQAALRTEPIDPALTKNDPPMAENGEE